MMMKPEPDELELALRARNGDREALAELIERLRFGLFALAYAELRHYEDAQDAVPPAPQELDVDHFEALAGGSPFGNLQHFVRHVSRLRHLSCLF